MNLFERAANATYLIVQSGEELFGIPLKYVVHIIPIQKLKETPDLPSYVAGKINHEGASIPVIDLQCRLNREAVVCDEESCIVILHVQGSNVGLLVSAVGDIRELEEKNFETEEIEERGMVISRCKKEEREIAILDVAKVVKF